MLAIIKGRIPQWRDRTAANCQRPKGDFRDWAISVSGPMLAEVVTRHYVAFKAAARSSGVFTSGFCTPVAWGAAGGLLMMQQLPLALAGSCDRFSKGHGSPDAQDFWASLLKDVVARYGCLMKSRQPEAVVHLACEIRKICMFLHMLSQRYPAAIISDWFLSHCVI